MTDKPVVTRFAPSPTGFLHIGGARTALFNWLYAKHHGGKMLLRIEDTDQARNSKQAVDAIIDGLTWLGLDWDDEPISQASRAPRHVEVANHMLADGTAYKCYCTPTQVAEMRTQAQAEGRPFRHRCGCRDKNNKNTSPPSTTDVDPVIRLKAPTDGGTTVDDQVMGKKITPNADLDDFVILRSDGSPTYMLAVVVDDHDMGVTHIIRGADHQTNAAKQTLIYQALMWDVPVMAHVPLIHGMDGAKLSKRHGATGAEVYRQMGYLPAALRNYLVRLGWSHGDDEVISQEDMIRWFGFDGMGKSACRFDFRKLNNLNGQYIRAMENTELLQQWKVCLSHSGEKDEAKVVLEWINAHESVVLVALTGLKARAKTLVELTDSAPYLWRQRPLDMDAKATKILDGDGAPRAVLGGLYDALDRCDDWNVENLETVIKANFEQQHLQKLGQLIQPLRAALTGRGVSHGIYDVLVDLGREESLARIKDQM